MLHNSTRQSTLRTVSLILGLSTMLSHETLAGDWPNWLGPRHDATSTESSWSADWNTGPPATLWSREVGIGFSSMSISEGRLLTAGHTDGIDTVWCLNAATGAGLWTYGYECPIWDRQHEGGPGTTPTISGRNVYTLSREGHLFCFDVRTGDVVWKTNVRKQFNVPPRPSKPQKDYGYTGSPLIVDRNLIVPVGGRNANTVAFDRDSGEVRWASGNEAGETGPGYGAPLAFQWNGEKFLAIFSLKELEVLEVETGRQRALFPWPTSYGVNALTPVVENNRIYIASDFGSGIAGFEFDGKQLRELFRRTDVLCKFNNPIVRNGTIYASTTSGVFKCIDSKTGKLHWQHRSYPNASLLLAGNRFLCLGDRGDLLAAKMTPNGYKSLSQTKVIDGRCWTPPALANGVLYVRNANGRLVALDLISRGGGTQPTGQSGD